MKKEVFKIEGMHCVSCARSVEEEVKKVAGVSLVKVNFASAKMIVGGEDFSIEEIKRRLKKKKEKFLKLNWKKENQSGKIEGDFAIFLSFPLMITMALMYLGKTFPGQIFF